MGKNEGLGKFDKLALTLSSPRSVSPCFEKLAMQQIIAMGGGGFSMEPDNPALDQYIIEQAREKNPKVCFLGQASAEHPDYLVKFYNAFSSLEARPTHLSLFKPHTSDLRRFLSGVDVVYVGGGNTRSMLALWREWGLDDILHKALRVGVVLSGISAGCICWFEQGSTDSMFGMLGALPCLGYLPGSCSPHYDGEEERRPAFHRMIKSGELESGYAFDDGCIGHFIDGQLHRIVTSRKEAGAYYVERDGDEIRETRLEATCLID